MRILAEIECGLNLNADTSQNADTLRSDCGYLWIHMKQLKVPVIYLLIVLSMVFEKIQSCGFDTIHDMVPTYLNSVYLPAGRQRRALTSFATLSTMPSRKKPYYVLVVLKYGSKKIQSCGFDTIDTYVHLLKPCTFLVKTLLLLGVQLATGSMPLSLGRR